MKRADRIGSDGSTAVYIRLVGDPRCDDDPTRTGVIERVCFGLPVY